MSNGLVNVDGALMRAHQWAYDYVWDRWGIYVGTYRSAPIVAALFLNLMNSYIHLPSSAHFMSFVISTLINAVLFWFVFLKFHMELEWKLQDDDRTKLLNRLAIREQNKLTYRWVSTLLIVGIGMFFFDVNDPPTKTLMGWVSTFIFLQWLWAKTVMIRERDKNRFAQRKLAYAGGRA